MAVAWLCQVPVRYINWKEITVTEPTTSTTRYVLLGAAGVVAVAILGVVLLTSNDEPEAAATSPSAAIESPPATTPEAPSVAVDEPVTVVEVVEAPELVTEPPVVDPEPQTEEPIDASDAAVKSALLSTIFDDQATARLGRLLVDSDLIDRFIVNANLIGQGQLLSDSQLIKAPEQPFQVIDMNGTLYLDPMGFERYTPYVDALESMDVGILVSLFSLYHDVMEQRFAEVSAPDLSLQQAVLNAIEEVLATPIIERDIELYSDSVMYKFSDQQLENLSAVQKQVIRTGPENTRRIKAVLSAIREKILVRNF